MKKQITRTIQIILLLCIVLLQAVPASALQTERVYLLDMQTATLSSYAFRAEDTDFSDSHLFYDQLVTQEQKALYDLIVCATPADGALTLPVTQMPSLPVITDPTFESKLIAYLAEQVLPAYAAACEDAPMLFWTKSISYSCSYSMRGDELVGIDIICLPVAAQGFSASNYESALAEIQNVLDGLSFDGTTRKELLTQFHDYLCDTIVYIDSAYAHNIYGALVEGEAVCEGYARAFKLFCDLYGIPCMLITGDALTSTGYGPHAWNAVRMEDGNWYGVDVTWDDQSKIYYDFFLVGSQSVPEHFQELTFAESHIESGDFFSNGAVIMEFPTLAEGVYTHTHIYDGGTVTVSPTCTHEGEMLYSCLGCDDTYTEPIAMIAHDYQNGSCTMCGQKEQPDITYGDCNGDDTVNGKDLTRLLRYLATFDPFAGTSTVELGAGADCNGDGVINGKDVTRLLRYLALVDPSTGESSVVLGK